MKNLKDTEKTCPECGSYKIKIQHDTIYCEKCGLILSANNEYVAGFKINLPWGIKLK